MSLSCSIPAFLLAMGCLNSHTFSGVDVVCLALTHREVLLGLAEISNIVYITIW